ncbi:hypothetical protein LJC33_06340 [Eubacteriales bacterium OttesenSCG-928-N13]|nr:hypothetical protein [Eubacteriales bacterium OttesenSCG-928-N13]
MMESFDLKSARHWARELIERKVQLGDTALDATMGNGHDTKWLCELVGENGHVYSFDVQPGALMNTRKLLTDGALIDRAELILDGHEHMARYVDRPVDVALFNLGWLPGGDKRITTRSDTTLAALDACLTLMKPGGLMTVCVYPGHEEGAIECEMVLDWAQKLPARSAQTLLIRYLNQPAHTPLVIAVHKR